LDIGNIVIENLKKENTYMEIKEIFT